MAVLATAARAAEENSSDISESSSPLIGPLVGHVDASTAILWARVPTPGDYRITLNPEKGTSSAATSNLTTTATADRDADLTVRFPFANLTPATTYTFTLHDSAGVELATNHFRTAPAADTPSRVVLAFGSCALEDAGSRAVWQQMQAEGVEGVVLTGDTPYIDSTHLAKQRRRYREFASVPEYQQLLATRPHWGTWDDHDFGANDCDGTLPGKENSRRAFTEYRALPQYGDGEQGIYSSFRFGPVEVFLLDTRWFSQTAPSFVDPSQKTLLGREQWEWLQRGLRDSTAPFKILACGMIWDDKENKEKDDWATYAAERRAVLDFIRREKIAGVLLCGGDIHVTRVLKYLAAETVGYPLYQFVSSPIHHKTIPALNVPHPSLLHSAVEPNTFLKLTADSTQSPPRLTADFINRHGKRLFPPIEVTTEELAP
jgi:alkaline phosphatase D